MAVAEGRAWNCRNPATTLSSRLLQASIFFTWFKNHTPQNEAALRAEQHKNQIIRLQDSAVIALVVAVSAGGTYMVVRFVRRSLDKRRAIVR